MRNHKIITYRYEPFGGILHLAKPAALVWVDKDYMRNLGYPDSPLWDMKTELITAPTEVHYAVTGQCSAGCKGCYVNSYLPGQAPEIASQEFGFEGAKKVADALADINVFHLALGGGESLELPWFLDYAEYVRSKKIIPNLTTNGFCLTEKIAASSRIFGQINVSIDGIENMYRSQRGVNGFAEADRALTLLKKARANYGINVVVTRQNFDHLIDIVRYARKKGVNQIEMLRFKPAGRGLDMFSEMNLTPGQSERFFPMVRDLAKRYGVRLRLDCSFMPMVFTHQPDLDRATFFAIEGCLAGELLMGVKADGAVNACSFARAENWDVLKIGEWWESEKVFAPYRRWRQNAPEPCASCEYLDLCRGGCHVVSEAIYGDTSQPDPGCPKVREYYGPIQ